MIPETDTLRESTLRLHRFLCQTHWNGRALEGPDSGVRFNAHFWRFAKSYLGFFPWSDNRVYLQAQGYWILCNWRMFDLLGGEQNRRLALTSSQYVLDSQRPAGYWEYPDPERRGKIATVEGDYATLGLQETHARTGQESLLAAAIRWHRFLVEEIGFQGKDGLLAVNYFAHVPSSDPVPNNSTLTLRTLAKLAQAAGDQKYLAPCKGMVAWLNSVQSPTGELPYTVGGLGSPGRPHFLCYQYNAFELLDLCDYFRVSQDETIWPVMQKLARFLSGGLSRSGAARYDCHHQSPVVFYYTAAVAAALSQATALGLGSFRPVAERAYRWVLCHQRKNGGSEFFSRRNYGWLADRRSYPRNLAMVLYHLLLELGLDSAGSETRSEETPISGRACAL